MKTLSYLIAGRISTTHSAVIAELLYGSSSLVSLFHDHILRKHHNLYSIKVDVFSLSSLTVNILRLDMYVHCLNITIFQDQSSQWLKSALASIECIEVFIEIASQRYGSPLLRWILVFSVELIKWEAKFFFFYICKPIRDSGVSLTTVACYLSRYLFAFVNIMIRTRLFLLLFFYRTVGRFVLLHKYSSRLRPFPIIRKLNRKSLESDSSDDEQAAVAVQSESFYTLNNSGRKVKSIANSK